MKPRIEKIFRRKLKEYRKIMTPDQLASWKRGFYMVGRQLECRK